MALPRLGDTVDGAVRDGLGKGLFFPHQNQTSGFEHEKLCRKCLRSVEHFVSSSKTTTKKS